MTALAYRPAQTGDLRFVLETFLDSFRLSHAAGLIAMEDWREVMAKQWGKLIAPASAEIVVAYHPGESGQRADLYGWISVDKRTPPPFVLYAYVKQPYRKMGILRGLLLACGLGPDAGFEYAAKTPASSKLVDKFPRASWNPLRARFPCPT